MSGPKIEKEDLLLLSTKNCETPIEQTHTKPEETLEFKLTKPRETFHFNPPIPIQGSSLLGLTSLEVYNSIFNITEENNKFEFYTDNIDEFSFQELGGELEEIVNISKTSNEHLQHKTLGPRIISANKKLETEKRRTVFYYILLMGYARSPIRDFETYQRMVIRLNEDDIQLTLKQWKANFVCHI